MPSQAWLMPHRYGNLNGWEQWWFFTLPLIVFHMLLETYVNTDKRIKQKKLPDSAVVDIYVLQSSVSIIAAWDADTCCAGRAHVYSAKWKHVKHLHAPWLPQFRWHYITLSPGSAHFAITLSARLASLLRWANPGDSAVLNCTFTVHWIFTF